MERLGSILRVEHAGGWIDIPRSELRDEEHETFTNELRCLLPTHFFESGGADLNVRMRKLCAIGMNDEKALQILIPPNDELAGEQFASFHVDSESVVHRVVANGT
jgi:hypothetical protein